MAKKTKKSKANFNSPILYIAIGLLLILFKESVPGVLMTLAGVFFLVSGIVDFVQHRTFSGVVNVVIAAIIFLVGGLILDIILTVIGVLIAVKGLIELIEVLTGKKKKRNALRVIFPVVTIILGIALAFGTLLESIILVVGVLLVVDGVLGLLGANK